MRCADRALVAVVAAGLAVAGCKVDTRPLAGSGSAPAKKTQAPVRRARPGTATPPAPAPAGTGRRLDLPCKRPMRVAVGNLDGKGRPEIVVACDDAVVVADASGRVLARWAAVGWPQVLRAADLDGDGRAEIIVGFGRSRRHLDAKAKLYRLRWTGEAITAELLLAPSTTRPEIADVAVEPSGALLVAHYVSKYEVRHIRLQLPRAGARGAAARPRVQVLGKFRMGSSIASYRPRRGGPRRHVVGRMYGDAIGKEGDAFVWANGKRQPLPTVRGVRSLAVAKLDGDARETILVGDGWAQHYVRDGRALLAELRPRAGGGFERHQLAALAGDFTIERIHAVDVDGDKHPELLVVGSATVRLLALARGAAGAAHRVVRSRVVARHADDAAAADLDGDGRAEVVVVGRAPAIIKLPR